MKKKISFKQPKYMLPAILYLPLIGLGWLVIDMFQTDTSKADTSDLVKVETLNPNLPDARVNDLGSKKDNMLKSFGHIKDESAVRGIERDSVRTEDFSSKYSDEELRELEAKIREDEQSKLDAEAAKEAEARRNAREERDREARRTVKRGSRDYDDDDSSSGVLSEEDRLMRSQKRQDEMYADLERELGQRLGPGGAAKFMEFRRRYGLDAEGLTAAADSAATSVQDSAGDAVKKAKAKLANGSFHGTDDAVTSVQDSAGDAVKKAKAKLASGSFHGTDDAAAVSVIDGDAEDSKVVKRVKGSGGHFNTLGDNEHESRMLRAIIDEEVKVVDGSRVRLRLLDDAEVSGVQLKKGSYLYAIMSGFSKQRVQGTVESIMVGDELLKVTLSIYDTDGMEGLYVPSSSFRETSKEVAGEALQGGNLNMTGSTSSSITQMATQALSTAYSRTTSAISKAIKKNKVRLKYGTHVYLVNGKTEKKKR